LSPSFSRRDDDQPSRRCGHGPHRDRRWALSPGQIKVEIDRVRPIDDRLPSASTKARAARPSVRARGLSFARPGPALL
jgi:hypothetical protein